MTPYYQDSAVSILHGDCLEILPQIGAVDHVITDPPYSEHTHNKSRRGGADGLNASGFICDYSRNIDLGFAAIDERTRIAVSDAVAGLVARWVLVFSDVESCHLWRAELVVAGLEYVRTGEWRKLNGTPQFTGDRPGIGFETITICHKPGRKRWNGGGTDNVWTHAVENNRGRRNPRLHTTQKPLPLMHELVRLFTGPGELILDPFMGSGTTLRAAKDLGRRAIGIEIEEKYCEIAAKRMAQETLFKPEPVVPPAKQLGLLRDA